jgi:hypothetical protein
MHRFLFAACLLGCGVSLWAIPGASQEAPPNRTDPAAAIKALDTNGDKKLSKDEFLKLTERNAKLKGNAELAARLFTRLDTNGDGSLTLEEYAQLGKAPGGKPPMPEQAALPAGKVAKEFVKTPTSEQVKFFEAKIRPVLVDRCYSCHSAKAAELKGGLALDTRDGLRVGGDKGRSIVPGSPDKSLLIRAVRHTDEDYKMPPQEKLPAAVIADLEQWVAMGAPDPREGAANLTTKRDPWEAARDWWAWQPAKKSPAPQVKDTAWAKNDIDHFLLAAMEAKGLKPVGDADKLVLLRRVTFDLTGLPPSTKDIDAFLKDSSPNAFAAVVDRLLRSSQFGEKWGRHWLDVARYAESTGKDINLTYPNAWRYRDYVIAAFNNDKPYNQFLREQIAGDLLPAKDDKQRAEQIVATGFLAIGTKSVNQANARQFALDLADEQIDTVSQALLGTTVACARCHDHKFDPIPQKEYYALAGIFLSTDTHYGTFFAAQNRSATQLIELPRGAGAPVLPLVMTRQEREQKQAELTRLLKETNEMAEATFKPAGANRNPRGQLLLLLRMNQVGLLESELGSFGSDGKMRPLAMGVVDQPARRDEPRRANRRETPSYASSTPDQAIAARFLERDGRFARPPEFRIVNDSPVFDRGDMNKPGEKVPRGFLSVLTHAPAPKIPAVSSGRRELAEWMLTESNPLTARVMVNRVWQWLFGQGLVGTPDNFGTTGSLPSNQALLDTLAVNFGDNGWSVKALIREIVLSRAYQLSSTFDEKNFAADPENALVWRMSQRRLDAEAIRDAILSASGQLDLRPSIGSPIAERGNGPIGQFKQFPGAGVPEDMLVEAGARTNVRSVYLPIARDLLPDVLAVFDFAEPGFVNGRRETTNVPSQALFLLNSPFIATAAQKFGERVIAAHPGADSFDQRLELAYSLAFSRAPNEAERQAASSFISKFPGTLAAGDSPTASVASSGGETAAWTSLCRVLFASAEFRYLK